MEIIKEEVNEVELSKEEKLLNALTLVHDEQLFNKAKFLYQKELYTKEVVKEFDETLYTDITVKIFKGYSLYTNENGSLLFVKELDAEADSPVYGYEIVSLADVTDEQMHILKNYKRPVAVLPVLSLSTLLLFSLLTLYTFIFGFLEYLENGFSNALLYAYLSVGSSLAICLAAIALIFAKSKKHGCKCKK